MEGEVSAWLSRWLAQIDLGRALELLRAGLLLVAGLAAAKLVAVAVARGLGRHLGVHHQALLRRVTYWGVLALFVVAALHQLGFDLGVLLGAAGILSVAVGFASQTSASNLISGLFLLAERPFSVGDIIKVGETTGEVISVDLLSVKIRTFDNLFVRVPNETVIKSEVTTLTKFPIRRIDLKIGVAYKSEMAQVRDLLHQVAERNPLCLEEPPPLFIFRGYGDSALELQFSVWGKRENFLELRNSILEEIKIAFDAAGIEIPFPHLSLYTGSVTDPFPVRIAGAPSAAAGPPPGEGRVSE
ncbi:MAG: mechanosensitive ion channel family protein [Nitrospirae bacterium]|nr:MAG: mechanosensitive ion channel family protein [Nitrospirota bacterium]